ncbi:hypothetical protein [Bacillus phage BC-T25]|nr:hypothetical protein [Bacillus phage BC-T25]
MFIWIMLALALIWVGLAYWGHKKDTKKEQLQTQKVNSKAIVIEKATVNTTQVNENLAQQMQNNLDEFKKESSAFLRKQGEKPSPTVKEQTKTFTSHAVSAKNYKATSVAARKQTSTSTASRNTSRNRNDDDYNNNFLSTTAFLQTNNDNDSGRCYGGGHSQSHHDTGGSGGGYNGGHDSGGSDGGGSVSCD